MQDLLFSLVYCNNTQAIDQGQLSNKKIQLYNDPLTLCIEDKQLNDLLKYTQ